MQPKSDAQLLREYAERGSDAAFTEIVARHTDLVYSAALRQAASPDLARDVAQNVFADLARKARAVTQSLSEHSSLAGWLYRGTRFEALTLRRDDFRRQSREKEAMEQLIPTSENDPDWERLRPALDEAMAGLGDTDREALVLRYFKNHDLRAVGAALGMSDDAAQKRVSRALDKVRESLSQRGIAIGASGFAALVSAHAVHAAPAGLATSISAALALGAGIPASTAIAATKTITMTTLQKTAVAATLAVLAGVGIYEARLASNLRRQVQTLEQESAPLADQIRRLQAERDAVNREIARLREGSELSHKDTAELARLREEVGRLRSDSKELARTKGANPDDPIMAEAVSWQGRVKLLKQHLAQNPSLGIPELQLATDQEWLDAARGSLDTEKDYRQAMSNLRRIVEGKFAGQLRPALSAYLEANASQFPTDLSQLQPFFKEPVNEAILQRYAILPKGEISSLGLGGDWIISQKAPVDAELDWRVGIGPFGSGSTGPQSWKGNSMSAAIETLAPVLKEFSAANGREPLNPAELSSYLKTPEQRAAYERLQTAEGAKARTE